MARSGNWADLPDGPTGLIADRVLANNDVIDFPRFRAACPQWQRCAVDPRAHGSLDRRFHPRRWTMLREEHAAPTRRSFLNTSTGECVQVNIPQLRDHHVLALTPEGLLLLLDKPQCTAVRLLNPFTGHVTELPPLDTLVPHIAHYNQRDDDDFARIMTAWGSGLADDDRTVVLCLSTHHRIGIAKPGDDRWMLLRLRDNLLGEAPFIMFAGRFYCVTRDGVMVLKMDEGKPPRLELAVNLNMGVSLSDDYMHLVDNCGELLLVHRQRYDTHSIPRNNFNMWRRRYGTYRRGKGRAVFMGMYSSLSVSLESFPAGSIIADTIYLSFDFGETEYSNVGAYHLTSGCLGRDSRRWGGLVPQPHTLVDCLCFANTLEYII
ncbi:hypothetical protein VPH35_048156 [Triticum aestivum]